jgi:RNA polymerase sigma-70 factor (ECF subfamily)
VRRRDDTLRRVYREHVQAVYAFFAYAVDQATAEDLTSATFEKVIRAWDRYDAAKAGERTWILAIARNTLNDHYRRRRFRDAVSTDEHPALLDSLAGEDEYERVLDRADVAGWLDDLAPRERELLALRYGADLTAADIAALTGLTAANVHQILSRSLRRLRTQAQV